MCMELLGFTSSLTDTDAWRREATKSNISNYYYYVLIYMYDWLVVSENPGSIPLEEIWKNFALKKDLIGPPSKYLGGKIQRVEMENV